MNLLIVDVECLGLDLALRAAAAGHKVKLFQRSKKAIRDGEGFKQIERISDWRGAMPWAKDGLIVCTGNCALLDELDRFREFGYPVFAPTKRSAKLEVERGLGMEVLKQAGIDVPPYEVFDSIEDAEKFARKTDKLWVFKPLGDEEDKSLTFVTRRDPAQLVGWLRRKIDGPKKMKGKCMLQEKIDAEYEIGINGWFGPEGFLEDKFQISFEHKPYMPGDIGRNTGEQISISQYVDNKDKLAVEMLAPLVTALHRVGHVGDICVGCMIDKKGKAWPLEFTARLGYPALFGQIASHKNEDPIGWMKALLAGEDELRVDRRVCTAVVLAQPNYPCNTSPPELVEGNPIDIEDEESTLDHLHFCSVMVGRGPDWDGKKVVDGPQFQTSGEYVMVATALGATIESSRERVYETVKKVDFPNKEYRNDAGDKVLRNLDKMHQHGYALNLE